MKQSSDCYRDESSQAILNDAERQSMKESLMSYMERNPVQESALESDKKSGLSDIKNKLLGVLGFF